MCGFSSHQDTYPQFPRSLLGMPGTMTTIWHGHIKKRAAFLESCSAKASLTNKHLIFSSSYQLWLIRRKAFFRHCIPHILISLNDTAIVRNFCAKKFYPWCKSKKLSKDLPNLMAANLHWFACDLKRRFKWSAVGKWIHLHTWVTLKNFANAPREISSHSGLKKVLLQVNCRKYEKQRKILATWGQLLSDFLGNFQHLRDSP